MFGRIPLSDHPTTIGGITLVDLSPCPKWLTIRVKMAGEPVWGDWDDRQLRLGEPRTLGMWTNGPITSWVIRGQLLGIRHRGRLELCVAPSAPQVDDPLHATSGGTDIWPAAIVYIEYSPLG